MPMFTHRIDDYGEAGAIIYMKDEGGIAVSSLYVAREKRMNGIGGRLLQKVCDLADCLGLPIYLSAVALEFGPETLPYPLLREFYMRRGFQLRPGRYGDSALVRYPITPEGQRDAAQQETPPSQSAGSDREDDRHRQDHGRSGHGPQPFAGQDVADQAP